MGPAPMPADPANPRTRDRLLGVFTVEPPAGPPAYRRAARILQVLVLLFTAVGLFILGVFLLLAIVVLLFSLLLGVGLPAVVRTFIPFWQPGGGLLPGTLGTLGTFLLAAAVVVLLTLAVLALVNHAYLRWTAKAPDGLWWARGVSVLSILWAAGPTVQALLRGEGPLGQLGVLTILVGGAGAWLLWLTFDGDVVAELAPGGSRASPQVAGRDGPS